MKIFTIILFFMMCTTVFSQNLSEKKCAVFPESSLAKQEDTPLNYTEMFNSSGSIWAVPFDESVVYRSLLSYAHPTDTDKSYELRIGKGGQVYSFKTSAGETIPPQWRNPASGNPNKAPWVDEVWQIVAVDGALNDAENDNKYFIHQAGVYLNDPTIVDQQPFYSPQVASYYNATNQEYTTVNWGQHAHLEDNLSANFTSSILYYTKYKNLGEGIIQVDYMIYNFGNDTITHTNLPWGGVRRSTYDNFFVSNADNSYQHVEGLFSNNTSFQFTETNGWIAFSSNDTGTSPSLGLIVNNDQGVLRTGDAGGTVENRNYTVYSAIKNGFSIDFGKIFRVRNYFILDSSIPNIQAKIAILNLQDHTYADFDNKTVAEVENTNYFFTESENGIDVVETNSTNGLELQLQPYDNGIPLFIIKGINDSDLEETRITSDLYTFSSLPYDGHLLDIELLGFSNSKKIISLENATVCSGDDYTFSDGTIQTNIREEFIYFSDLGTDVNGYNNYMQTSITIDEDLDCILTVENNEKLKFKISPNPVVDVLISTKKVLSAKVFDTTGQLIKAYGKGSSFEVSAFSSGLYYLLVELEKGEVDVVRFIKK